MLIPMLQDVYTQCNTNETDYIVQVFGVADVGFIAANSEPTAGTHPDLILSPKEAISSNDIAGSLWAVSLSRMPAGKEQNSFVGVTEGA